MKIKDKHKKSKLIDDVYYIGSIHMWNNIKHEVVGVSIDNKTPDEDDYFIVMKIPGKPVNEPYCTAIFNMTELMNGRLDDNA